MLMLHPETEVFTTALLDHYDETEVSRTRLVTGSFMLGLDQARAETESYWQEVFNVDIPESMIYEDYVIPRNEQRRLDDLRTQVVLGDTDANLLRSMGVYLEWDDSSTKKRKLNEVLADMRREVYREALAYDRLEPNMTLQEPVEMVPALKNPSSLECAVSVFGMNAIHFINGQISPGNQFNTTSAFKIIERHPRAPAMAMFDLPWLLRALSTPFAERVAGQKIRTVTTIGADLGEIEAKVITPIRRKLPEAQFVINAVLASDSNKRSNHAVTIVGASDEVIQILDPKKDRAPEQEIKARDFWDRWISTNMQAVVTVAQAV